VTHDSQVFRNYAKAYEALYRDKNYAAECDSLEQAWQKFALQPVKSVLDLGCGTGGHVFPLAARGYRVLGVDRSEVMLSQARTKAATAAGESPRFQTADVQSLDLGETFDGVICMFAVLSYQTSNAALMGTLRSARRHLIPGGLFICDFWYGPAVLKQRPLDRVKEVRDGEDRILRLASPSLDTENGVVTVSYQLLRLRGQQVLEETREQHQMRYLFRPELQMFMEQAGLELLEFYPFGAPGQPVSEDTWNVSAIARAF